MSFFDDLKKWASAEDDETELEEFTTPRISRREEEEKQPGAEVKRGTNNKVVNINATTQLSVVLVKPDKYENAPEIADHLRERRTVVMNLEQTNKDVAKRLIDFLSGVTYAQEGKIKRVANSTYMITPYNVDILGDLIDELENNGLYI
jgi:cell division inhibitor SepF